MLVRFAYLAFCATPGVLVRDRSDVGRDAELAVLRHEAAVLRRTVGHPRIDGPTARWRRRSAVG